MDAGENYRRIRREADEEALRAGRQPADVEVMAVTKYVDTDRIARAIDAGCTSVGENKVQEYREKAEFFASRRVTCDIIGRLQTNKVKYIAGAVRYVQSVDREELARELSRICVQRNVHQDILVEVNIGGEEQKGGVEPCRLRELLHVFAELPAVSVKGLMCIPPAVTEQEAEAYFEKMYRLYADIKSEHIDGVEMRELSMGMSGDYKAAIRQGATIVRVGTAVFGARY